MLTDLSSRALSKAGGALVEGIDASKPMDKDTANDLYDLYLRHGYLLLRDQHLTPQQHIDFSRAFGGLDIHPIEQIRLPDYPEIIELSIRPKAEGLEKPDEIVGQIPWHSDLTYTDNPSWGAVLYAREVPEEGGETGFVDTAAAYDALDEETKRRIDGLEMIHSGGQVTQSAVKTLEERNRASAGDARKPDSNAKSAAPMVDTGPDTFPPVIHPLVVVHPESGRKVLNISPAFARRILGLPEAEADNLLKKLVSHATAPERAYVHTWRVGDIVIWDNWRTMHMAAGCKAKYRRLMHRTTLSADYQMGRIAA